MYTPFIQDRSLGWKRLPALLVTAVLLLGLIVLLSPIPFTPPTALPLNQLNLPLSFIPNLGQTDTAVQFQTYDMGGALFFTPEGVVLSLPTAAPDTAAIVQLQFEGANPAAIIASQGQLPGKVNYILGADPAQWRTDLPTYESIVYEELYPGIDLSYDGTNGRLKGTYHVAPGADPNNIGWRHVGASGTAVNQSTGNLHVTIAAGGAAPATLVEQAPIAWQEINGQRVAVPVAYEIAGDSSIGFVLGSYNPAYALTIDPTLDYSATFGGSSFEDAEGIAIDSAGNVYVTGTTNSSNFPLQNPYQNTKSGDDSAYVTKINVATNSLVYSTFISGSEDDVSNDIAVTSTGNAIIVGATDSTNFPTMNALQANNNGMDDAFILQLNANGNGLVFSTYLGGNGMDEAEEIALDSHGDIYITGDTGSANFPTLNPIDGDLNGLTDAFVTKLNSSGSAWVYSTYLGGSNMDVGAAIAVDGSGNAFILGETLSTNFPAVNAFQATKGDSLDMFVAQLNSSGSALTYSTYLGGNGADYSGDIAVNSAGQAVLTGYTDSTNFPTQNPVQASNDGMSDAFVAILSSSGSALDFSTYLGGSDADKGAGLALNAAGSIYVTGDTFSTNFPTTDPLQMASAGEADAFIAKISAGAVEFSTYLGGSNSDHGSAIAVDDNGNAYVAGVTASSTFPQSSPLGGSPGGVTDVFVVVIQDEGSQIIPPPPGPELSGSYKKVSQLQAGPDEELVYTIGLHNSGAGDALVTVSDDLPDELEYVPNSVTGGGVYSAGTITWNDVAVPAGEELLLTFAATSSVTEPVVVVNTAVITPSGEDPIERSVAVLLLPEPAEDDVIPPIVTGLTIDDQDVLTDPDVILHISATDNVGVEEMYLKEWALDTTPFPHWQEVQSSGWVPYQETYDWTLEATSGTHYIIAWVRDAADNMSIPTLKAGDYASLLLPGETVAQHGMVPYMVYYEAGVTVTATLTPSSGDADLYVWYPDNHLAPDQKSLNEGTAVDSVNFVTPKAGSYLFLVYGYTEATYDFSITPGGGSTANVTSSLSRIMSSEQAWAKTELTTEPVLTVSGLDPLGIAEPPQMFSVYLPIVAVNQP